MLPTRFGSRSHSREPSLFASHGIATLSLGYFGEPGLPTQLKNIPLEYFETVLQWLSTQPGVDPQRRGEAEGACAPPSVRGL